MHRLLKPILLLVSLCLTLPLVAPAQLTKNKFGKNRLQYKEFNWRYYSTNNFDIYFYDDGQRLAKLTADFMEDEYDRITDVLGYKPYSKTKIFLYNSIADLQQSNVGVNENNFTVGGETSFVKSHVEVAFPGTLEEFKEAIVYKVSHMLIMDMMFGGSLTDIFQNTYLMTLPEWFIDGAARYLAFGWSIEMDDFMRDLLQDGKMPKLNKLEGLDAGLVGQSVWNFIAEKHGRSSLSHILNYTRIIRNEETAVANTLGVPFKYFLVEWRSYYTEMVRQTTEEYRTPAEELLVSEGKNGKTAYNSLSLSPDGRYLAFAENYGGRFRIKVKDLESGKVQTVLRKGYRVLEQETDDTVPLVAWQNTENLGVIGVEKGLYTLYIHNLASEQTSSQVIGKISQVNDFSFSPNGKVIVMSAEKEGQNDIYLYSINRNSLRAITSDLYDDVFPVFMPGSNDILFSSNRQTDTLNAPGIKLEDITDNYNLFIFNIDTTGNVLVRVTNTISKDIRPQVDKQGNIFFLSDQKGIFNLFRYNLQDSLYKQITALSTSIQDYSIDFEKNALAFIALYEGHERVFYEQGIDLQGNNFTQPTPRQNTRQAKYVLRQLRANKASTVKPQLVEEEAPALSELADALEELVMPDTLLPDSLQLLPPDTLETLETDTLRQEPLSQEDTRPIDTDDYVFDLQEEENQVPQQQSFLSSYRKLRRRNTVQGPFALEPRFMVNSLITSWAIDPLRSSIGAHSVGFVLEGQMNDMLENHKIYGGLLGMTDLRSGDLFLEYEFLKYLLDFGVRVDRRVVFQPFIPGQPEKHKYVLNKIQFAASLPLSVTTRISAGPVLANTRFLEVTTTSLLSPISGTPTDLQTFYGGANMELVFDNTIIKGFNLYNGSRAKLQYTHLLGVGDSEKGFGKLTAEAKNYFPISREFIFATRGFFGSFVGAQSPKYILGGMDNWILNKTDESGRGNPLRVEPGFDNRNLLFHEFVTPLRGFNYNAFNGDNVLLFNAELRFPLIKYFYRGPISSNFFRNLLAVGFYDIGSAWSGKPPFFRNNSINTEEISNPDAPFKAVIQNYKNPWLSSAGFGVRTVLLGYYFKFDVAYPIIDYTMKDPRFFLTFGYDF